MLAGAAFALLRHYDAPRVPAYNRLSASERLA